MTTSGLDYRPAAVSHLINVLGVVAQLNFLLLLLYVLP
jgi:hypothetical protein